MDVITYSSWKPQQVPGVCMCADEKPHSNMCYMRALCEQLTEMYSLIIFSFTYTLSIFTCEIFLNCEIQIWFCMRSHGWYVSPLSSNLMWHILTHCTYAIVNNLSLHNVNKDCHKIKFTVSTICKTLPLVFHRKKLALANIS